MEVQRVIKLSVVPLVTLFASFIGLSEVSISKLQKTYSPKETIHYMVFNNSSKELFVRISAEADYGGRWHEIINDATNAKNISAILYHLPKMSSKSMEFKLKEIDYSHYNQHSFTLRLKIYYSKKPGEKEKTILSSPFEVK